MKTKTLPLAAFSLTLLALAGCSGSGTTGATASTSTTTQTFGPVTTRIVGTAQPPVFSAGRGSAIIGLAGALFSDITQTFVSPTPANTRIAFVSSLVAWERLEQIYTMNGDGTGVTLLTPNINRDSHYPTFSPDGSKIAFVTNRDYTEEIYVMNADGSNQTRLTFSTPGLGNYMYWPRWSPDGSKILYTSLKDSPGGEIYVMNANGTNPVRLTTGTLAKANAFWSPDGTKIAFSGYVSGSTTWQIYTMNADGSNIVRITNNTSSVMASSWSPDGSRIAYHSFYEGLTFVADPKLAEIYTMNPDGSGVVRLTNNTVGDTYPVWSPDGSKIAFLSERTMGIRAIYTMNADGSDVTRLSNSTKDEYGITWSNVVQTVFVGKNGLLGTGCAGFLVGQQGDASTSLLTFDTAAASRASTSVSATTGAESESPNLAFHITTTAGLTSVKFINPSKSLKPVAPTIPSGSTGALVLFSSATGLVTSVLPYTANRSAPVRVQQGSTSISRYQGNFTAIFNDKGENLAPTGAKTVTLDEKSGTLVGFK